MFLIIKNHVFHSLHHGDSTHFDWNSNNREKEKKFKKYVKILLFSHMSRTDCVLFFCMSKRKTKIFHCRLFHSFTFRHRLCARNKKTDNKLFWCAFEQSSPQHCCVCSFMDRLHGEMLLISSLFKMFLAKI